MARKNFKRQSRAASVEPGREEQPVDFEIAQIPPASTVVQFGEHFQNISRYDFAEHYGHGCDHIVFYCHKVIENLVEESDQTRGQTLAMTTVVGYCDVGLRQFLPFCANWASALRRDISLEDVDHSLVQRFIQYLAESGRGEVSQKLAYDAAKSVLMAMAKRGWISRNIFPKNPYPNSNRKKKGENALSKPERQQVMKALKGELQRKSNDEGALSNYDLGVCVFAIAARSGLTPTSILELPVDCLQAHPLKSDRRLLVSYKRRGNGTHIQSLRRSEEVELSRSVMPEVVTIIERVAKRNAEVRQSSAYPNLLFVFEARSSNNARKGFRLRRDHVRQASKSLVDKYGLTDDDGRPLRLNGMRLRKTLENRIFELSGQDAFVTAAIGNHSVKISNDHYLEAPNDAERNFRFMGEIWVQSLLEGGAEAAESGEARVSTPVAGCTDPINGHRAPKDGSHCVNFIKCFICKSFVVTPDDLYRVYSLYWMLVRERQRIGARMWSRYYAHVIRIIDNQIGPQFDAESVNEARDRARRDPHPYWRDPEVLEG